jgi:hypothetical protein
MLEILRFLPAGRRICASWSFYVIANEVKQSVSLYGIASHAFGVIAITYFIF